MSKITFRADDDLVEELEALEVSKSEAMREALRAYLESGAADRQPDGERERGRDSDADRPQDHTGETAIDDIVRKHVDDLLTERLGELERERERERKRDHGSRGRAHAGETQDVNVTISLEGQAAGRVDDVDSGTRAQSRRTAARDAAADQPAQRRDRDSELGHEDHRTCNQCGEDVDDGHVYCPNCGDKVSQRLFCECGDELRSDWGFCPGCGRRTPTADVLESNSRDR